MNITESKPGVIRLDFQVSAIRVPQRWLADLENYIRVHSALVVYECDSILGSLTPLLNPLLPPKRHSTSAPEICFVHDKGELIYCYTGDDNLKIMQALNSLKLGIQMLQGGIVLQEENQMVAHLRLFSEQSFGRSYRAPGVVPRSSFPVIAAAPMPIDAKISFAGGDLPADLIIQGRVRFSNLERFSLK